MSITVEFPHFDISTLPTIPSNWEDVSWHNDTCPSFIFGKLHIYIDFANYEDRECSLANRFHIFETDDFQQVLESNDWQQVLDFVANYKG